MQFIVKKAKSILGAGGPWTIAATMALAAIATTAPLRAQGCIVARSTGQPIGPETEGGYLMPGEFDVSIGYRHQFSFRHYVGPEEQSYRIQQGTQVMNKINLETLGVTYQATPRFSFTVDLPLLEASRRSHNSPYTLTAQGIGDVSFTAQGWVFNPQHETLRGNVSFGFGMVLPTGKDNVMNKVDAFDGKGPVDKLADYSIQPGTGGYGIVFQWQSFVNVGSLSQAYFNGDYIATPQNTNHVQRSATINPLTLTQYVSISDEYLMEAGIARAIPKVRGLSLNFGPRMEGVPAQDLIGDSLGFRRPGFAISFEVGAQYAHKKDVFTATIGKAFYRDRTRSEPDRLTGGHGDAAFADYIWLASYSHRFGGHH